MPLITDKSLALVRIEEFIEENSQISDLNIVDLYDYALEEILLDSPGSWATFIGELRWRFVKSNPKDEDASKECFKACLLKGDLDHAIKVGCLRSTCEGPATFPFPLIAVWAKDKVL